MPNRLLGENTAAKHLLPRKHKTKKVDDEYWPVAKDKYDLGIEIRRPFERRWILSLAFLAGKQYVLFNSTAHILQQVQKVKGRSRTVDNILMPRWRRQVADMIRTKPSMSVVPNTNEEEDIKAAKVGDKVLKHLHRSLGMDKKYRELAGWIYSCGNAFLDHRWNTGLGPIKMNEDGKVVYLGDVDVGVWSPFEIIVPAYHMGETDHHRLPWLIKAKFRGLDYIRANYKRGKDVVAETRPNPIIGSSLVVGRDIAYDQRIPGAVLMDCYIKPCMDYPKGLFITAANGIVLQKADYPYDKYNVEHFKDIDIPGVFWGKSTVDVALPQQVRWNRTNNSIDEFNKTKAKGKLLAPKRSKLEIMPDDTHGEVVYYKPVMGHKPDYLSTGNLPPTYELSLNLTKSSVQDTFSQHEITFGTNKSDIRSGDMVGRLREQDAYGALPSHALFEESLEAHMVGVLRRVQEGYDEERMIKVAGRDNDYEVFAFKGADLRNNTDVRVKRQSSLPDSRVEREMQILRRYELGLYGDPADPEVRRNVMNMLEDAVVQDIYSDTKADELYSRWENRVMASTDAEIHLVNQYDNHSIHLREHNHFRKSMDYQRVKAGDFRLFMVLEQRFNQHVMTHQQFLDQERAQYIETQRLLQGGGEGNE